MRARRLKWLLNLYPPYLGTGIHVDRLTDDFREIDVSMRLRFYNRNFVGTHFGGSLYAMTDPFYMLMLIAILGRDYVIWDRAARIDFLRPGRGRVHAAFRVTDGLLETIHRETRSGEKYLPELEVPVTDAAGQRIALVYKRLYVRRRHAAAREMPLAGRQADAVTADD